MMDSKMTEIAKAKALASTQINASQKAQADAEKEEKMAELRQTMLSAILSPEAKERLNRIKCVKAEKAAKLEDMLITAAQKGQLRGKVDEKTVKNFLEKLSEAEPQVKVSFKRNPDCDIDLENLFDD